MEVTRTIVGIVLLLACLSPAVAQQNVRVRADLAERRIDIPAQLYRPAGQERVPVVAIFHGCGGPGMNNARMAGLLRDWGYGALVVDSFSSRGIKDACGRNWPSQADAEKRALDIDATRQWLEDQSFADATRLAVMGYSYGGGVAMLRAFAAGPPVRDLPAWRASILVYPDCALADALGSHLWPRQPTLFALAELDDWTPIGQCQAVLGRVTADRGLIEVKIYEGAHHSFDALGLPVRYLSGAGNRSKPGGCCGAHYGAHEPSWRRFVVDVQAFLTEAFKP
ncbi:MAG: dienelactone hydrolase family protein [Enhydrobacter sp.]|nr:MAG: dienelactone hydrolase family protein [Enhydrobacter sp.]